MKKTLLILAGLLLWVCSSSAEVLLVEDFNYVAGTAIGELDGWTTSGEVTSGDGRVTNATVLEYSNAGGTYGQSGSKSLRHSYSVGENYISYCNFSRISSGKVYLTYMYKPDGKQSQGNGELIGLTTGTSPSARPWVGKIDDTTKGEPYRIGLTLRSGIGDDIKWAEGEYSISDVLLLVLKYDIDNHTASLFINPTLGTSEEPDADVKDDNEAGLSARTNIEAIMFRNNASNKSNYYIGGVRVSTTWAEAVRAVETPPTGIARIATNFNDGTWGEVAESYTSGSYPSSTINGFQLNAAGMLNGSMTYAETEEKFKNRISVDKMANGGSVTLPAVSTIDQVNVYASTGTENQDIKLQQYNYRTGLWKDIDTYHFAAKSTCYKFTTTINSNVAVRLRLVNTSGGVKNIWKIETTPNVSKERLNYVFGDEVWNDLGTESPTATVNEVNFTACALKTGTYYAAQTAEKFTRRVTMDKLSSGGMMEFPAVASAARMDVYAASGSEDKDMTVQQYNYYTSEWSDVETLHFDVSGIYYRFAVAVNNPSITKLRIVNPDGSSKYILKVVTYASTPTTLSAPVASAATNVSAHSFTTSWSSVAGATGYRVIRYKDGALQRVETVGADITTFTFRDSGEKGVAAETEYSYAVVAIGDGETSVDSELSNKVDLTTAAEITDSYTRTVTNGNYGTICLPKACEDLSSAGAVFFVVAGKVLVGEQLSEIVFDEVTSLVAGKPYVFLAEADELNISLTGEAVESVVTSGTNGLKGSFTAKIITADANRYVLSNNLLYCTYGREYFVGENRAYFDISSMDVFDSSAPKAPGRRRVSMKAEPKQTPTGIGAAETGSKPAKLLLNGSVVIIRNGVQYDITGQRIH